MFPENHSRFHVVNNLRDRLNQFESEDSAKELIDGELILLLDFSIIIPYIFQQKFSDIFLMFTCSERFKILRSQFVTSRR